METNIDLVDYKTLSIQKKLFNDLNIDDPFFESLKSDYDGFVDWFKKKGDAEAYVLLSDEEMIQAFLFLKIEDASENYEDIIPEFAPAKRLKVGTFKVSRGGQRLGERFLKIIFDNALYNNVEEIYVTVFDHRDEQKHLISVLIEWGFIEYGIKNNGEKVFVRKINQPINLDNPKMTYPLVDFNKDTYIVPIYPDFHTNLFPDSILKTESPKNFVESFPHRNSIEKVFISRSLIRNLKKGDLIFFYRTKDGRTPAYYNAVVTTLGMVLEVVDDIPSESEFVQLCKNRSVFNESELKEWWNRNPNHRPFIVKFLHIESLPKRPNRKELMKLNFVCLDEGPRGLVKMNKKEITDLIEISELDKRIIKK